MLKRTGDGVRVVNDWGPERIGAAYQSRPAMPGEGMVKVQAAMLNAPSRPLPAPRRVSMLPSLERLVAFLKV